MTSSRAVTALRFLTRSLSLRGSSFLLALLAVTVGATITATMLNIRVDLHDKMSRELRRYGPNLLVVPAAEGPAGAASSTLAEQDVRRLPRIVLEELEGRGQVSLSPMLVTIGFLRTAPQERSGAVRTPSSSPAEGRDTVHAESMEAETRTIQELRAGGVAATIVGADFETLHTLYPSWRIEGSLGGDAHTTEALLAEESARRDAEPQGDRVLGNDWPCLAGTAIAKKLGAGVGHRLEILVGSRPSTAVVAGILSTGEAEDEQIFLPLARIQEATGLTGRVSLAALSVDGGAAAASEAARAIEAALPGVSAHPLRQIAAAQGAILAKLERMMLLLTIVVLALSGLCLVTTLMAIVVEREAEIGLMRSIGAGDGEVLAMFLGEVGLLGLIGGVAGLALGALGAWIIGARLFDAAIEPRLEVVPWVLGLSLGLCLVSILVPLRRALAVHPAVALRGE